jgi:hypothetical protein
MGKDCKAAEPTTLREAILYFADPKNCRDYLVARRWPNGVLKKYNRWRCRARHAARSSL